jgi:hypothetical protein
LGCVPKGKSEVEGVTPGYMGRENVYWRGLHNKDVVKYTGDQREKRFVGQTRMHTIFQS